MSQTRMLKKEELCKELGVSLSTIDDLVATGWLHPTFLGRGWKFSQEDILEFQKKSRGLDIRNYTKMCIEMEKLKRA